MVRLFLYVVVAPSRFAPKPFDDGQVGRAREFARDAFSELFDPVPTSAQQQLTLFATDGDDGYREHQLYVHRTGLVELLWALGPEGGPENLTIDLAEMASVVMRVAAAVGREPYSELSKIGRGRHRWGRIDWWFHAATGISGSGGPRSWTTLRFVGDAPPRARHDWAAAPPEGYGWQRLLNSRRSRPPEDVAEVLLTEFLTANGYYEFSKAVGETISEAASRLKGEQSQTTGRADHDCGEHPPR